MKDRTPHYEIGSGNVFEDLGFEQPETHRTKAALSILIEKAIEERGLTQTQAARIMGVAQPDVSRLVRGRVEEFSVERLMTLITRLDRDVEIVVRPAETGKAGHVTVSGG